MMLDSTLGKILATKQAEPAVPAASDTNSTGSKSKTPDPQPESSSKSKPNAAEVRLVVKFIVEEHTIYNGKIERVKQLQIEELSRIVSTIDWKSVDDSKDFSSSIETKKLASSEGGSHDLNQKYDSTNSAQANQQSFALDKDIDNNRVQEGSTQNESSQREEPILAIESTNHQATTNANSNMLFAQEQDTLTHRIQTPSVECDNSPSEHPIQSNETGQQGALELRHRVDSIDKQELVKNYITDVRNHAPNGRSPNYDDTLENDSILVKQSVTDTINDCVSRVETECRQLEEAAKRAAISQCENRDLSLTEPTKHNEPVRRYNLTAELVSSRYFDERRNDSLQEEGITRRLSNSNNGGHRSDGYKQEQTYQAQDLTQVNLAKKRPSSGQSNTGKRIRRVASKDQRDSNSKGSYTPKGLENSNTRLNSNSLQTTSTKNCPLADNKQMLQEKIFAKWTDNHFYPGTIMNQAKDQKFVVAFLDGAQKKVASTDMIPLCNIEGKQVRVTIAKNYCVNAIVHDKRCFDNEEPMFDVEYQQDGRVRKCVPFKDIFLTGEQGTPLVNQQEKSSREKNASNFADVDLNNIMFAKRSRRLQGMDDFELTKNSSTGGKRRRGGQYGMRDSTSSRARTSQSSPTNSPPSTCLLTTHDRSMQGQSITGQEHEAANSPDSLRGNLIRPNSNSPSEGSNSTNSSNAMSVTDIGQEFYFSNSSPHRTKTSVLL